jgi:hypothetical protein
MSNELLALFSMNYQNEAQPIDFKVFGEPLVKLLTALGNKLSREWPEKYRDVTGARELFVMHLRIAHLTYRSALYGSVPNSVEKLIAHFV